MTESIKVTDGWQEDARIVLPGLTFTGPDITFGLLPLKHFLHGPTELPGQIRRDEVVIPVGPGIGQLVGIVGRGRRKVSPLLSWGIEEVNIPGDLPLPLQAFRYGPAGFLGRIVEMAHPFVGKRTSGFDRRIQRIFRKQPDPDYCYVDGGMIILFQNRRVYPTGTLGDSPRAGG